MARKKILYNEIPDDDFEREMMKELDSSRVQEQYYLGVFTLTNKTIPDMKDGEESVRSPYKKEKTAEEMFERDYISQEEKNDIVEKNQKLIDKCVGQFMPKTPSEKKLYCIEDIIEACDMGFIRALDEYPRIGSSAKFSTYAYELMSNECRDTIKRARAKKRGLLMGESLDAPISSGSSKEEEETTLGELIGTNMNGEETEGKLDLYTMQSLILSAFQGMDEDSVLILTYKFGLGQAEYEHTEAEIADILGLPPAKIKKKLDEAIESFKLALYEEGLLAEAEAILIDDMGYSKKQIQNKLASVNQQYVDSMEMPVLSIGIEDDGDLDDENFDDEDWDDGQSVVLPDTKT